MRLISQKMKMKQDNTKNEENLWKANKKILETLV